MISFIVPAHNEEAHLGETLQAIRASARLVDQPYEVIVVDDASTDATAEIARQNDARVLQVNHRQIAATRNSGGRAAQGERLFFVDADTVINARVVASAMRSMDRGAAGGGALTRFADRVPLWATILLWWFNLVMRLVGFSGGAFMFCTREAFQAVGGFDERLYGAEDAAMAWALRREGRFVVLWHHVRTSGRRTRGMGGPRVLATLTCAAFFPKVLTRRSSVDKVWYQSNREADDQRPASWAVHATNAALLLILIALVPVWIVLPLSLTPPDTFLGRIRIGIAMLGCHVALVLWPCAYFLIRSLFRQKRWIERIKLVGWIALCLWLVWGASREVYWFWLDIISG